MIHWVGWRNKPGINSFVLKDRGLTIEIDIERVNVHPQKLYFTELVILFYLY